MRTALWKTSPGSLFAGASLFAVFLGGCTVAASDPMGGTPMPKIETRISPRVVGDPQCSVTPQTLAWVNPFANHPSTLPFYAPDGSVPVGGAVGGVDVPATVWFEQRLWTLMGRTPSDGNATMAVHPSTAVGYTWNAVEATPSNGYTQADLDKLIAAFANIDPVDASIPQCSYGMTANVAWDPVCGSVACDQFNWWTVTAPAVAAAPSSTSAILP